MSRSQRLSSDPWHSDKDFYALSHLTVPLLSTFELNYFLLPLRISSSLYILDTTGVLWYIIFKYLIIC